jgi:predicted short-subunit dehydrogenase-like oxidoreductase (DUF2520 family)
MKRTISIVGAGRVGRSLGKALRERGWHIGAVVTRSAASARAAVRTIGGGTAYEHITAQALAADNVLIATPDDVIASTARELARLAPTSQRALRGKIVLHTSGALHPMQTFSGRRVPNLEGIIFAVEGDAKARRAGRAIARTLGGVPIVIASRNKPAYHAAGALAAGHALALIEGATRVLMRIGFPRRRAEQTLLPLMREVLRNFERVGPRAAWTGPVARSDYSVVAKHAKALRKYPREFGQSYAALARLAARVLCKNPAAKLQQLDRAVGNPRGGKIEKAAHSR